MGHTVATRRYVASTVGGSPVGETLAVDPSAPHEGATSLRDLASQLEASPPGGPARSALVKLGSVLHPAGTATAVCELAGGRTGHDGVSDG
jgi:hypothetical protein